MSSGNPEQPHLAPVWNGQGLNGVNHTTADHEGGTGPRGEAKKSGVAPDKIAVRRPDTKAGSKK